MDSYQTQPVPSTPPQAAGKKRPATCLLPAIEFLPSSAYPPPAKRRALSPMQEQSYIITSSAPAKYPTTPIPTSSSSPGLISSPPSRWHPISFPVSEPTSSPPQLASRKRAATCLLPAIEIFPSSPLAHDRPAKRRAMAPSQDQREVIATAAPATYPTPIPTSSTGIISSPLPQRNSASFAASRPESTQSQLAGNAVPEQRAPLSSVPCLELPESGEPIIMGRSSNSSHYQISTNRLISRVHVQARYIPSSSPLTLPRVEVMCTGWNGLKLHSQGRTWELRRGDSFTSETEGTELLIDVQDARIMLLWPQLGSDRFESFSDDESCEDTPRQPVSRGDGAGCELTTSPLRRSMQARIGSASPTPTRFDGPSQRLRELMATLEENVEIYEDENGDNDALEAVAESEHKPISVSASPKTATITPSSSMLAAADESFSSELGDLEDEDEDEEEEKEENEDEEEDEEVEVEEVEDNAEDSENEPHSLDPSSHRLASDCREIVPAPAAAKTSPHQASPSPGATTLVFDAAAIANHAINQLAFSRLSSTPLSTILSNLPADQKRQGLLTQETLRSIIENIECIGTIERHGNDAAGKPLESEYYYLPQNDTDDDRRLAVTDALGRPTLRNCRKQHKQYYWKRPRTP